jgi:hypothetical protein
LLDRCGVEVVRVMVGDGDGDGNGKGDGLMECTDEMWDEKELIFKLKETVLKLRVQGR